MIAKKGGIGMEYQDESLGGEILNAVVAIAVLVAAVAIAFGIHACRRAGTDPTVPDTPADTPPVPEIVYTTVHLNEVTAGNLALCDADHPWSEAAVDRVEMQTVSLSLFTMGGGPLPYLLSDPNVRLQSEAAMAFSALAKAFSAACPSVRLTVTAGYLPYAGTAGDPHHTGSVVALSFLAEGTVVSLSAGEDDPLTRTAALWLSAHLSAYGFVRGTGETVRYVGAPHATYMESHQLSLGEYLSRLRGYTEDAPLKMTDGGAEYLLYYVTASHGSATVRVPDNAYFSVSGDGTGGFVVTLRLL